MANNKIVELLSYAWAQLQSERAINAIRPETRDIARFFFRAEQIRAAGPRGTTWFSSELRTCVSPEVHGSIKALHDSGLRGEAFWGPVVETLAPLAEKVDAAPAGESWAPNDTERRILEELDGYMLTAEQLAGHLKGVHLQTVKGACGKLKAHRRVDARRGRGGGYFRPDALPKLATKQP